MDSPSMRGQSLKSVTDSWQGSEQDPLNAINKSDYQSTEPIQKIQ